MTRCPVYASVFSIICVCIALTAPAAVSAEWSGFHVGIAIGGTESRSDTSTVVKSAGGYFTGNDHGQIYDAGNATLTQSNLSGGVQAGYGRQFGNIVVGIVASANSLSFDDTRRATVGYQSSPGNTFTLTQTVEADWMTTLRPRLGWAQENWLAYISAGLAVTQLKYDYRFTDTSFSASSRSTESKVVPGWTLGVGGEYALNGNWSLTGEYLYTAFSRPDSSSRVNETFGGVPAFLDHSANLDTHAAMIGVVYRFNPF